MIIKSYLLGVTALVVSSLFCVETYAQEELKLEEVVISTTKNDQKQRQTGKVVTIIGPEILERSHGKNLTDVLNEYAGVMVSGASGNLGLNKSIFIRGSSGAHVMVLIDGIVVSSPVGNGAAFDLRMFSIDQIDYIEIVKGGQSTIYGSDAVSGVINIITKKGVKGGNSVYGVGSYGNHETYKGTMGISSYVDNFSYTIAYTQTKTDGISEAARPANSSDIFEKDGNKTGAVNANFSLQLDKNLSINPFLRYFYGHYNFDANAFEDHLENNYKLKYFNGGFNAKYNVGSGKITFNYSYENAMTDSQSQYGKSISEGKTQMVDIFYNQKVGNHLNILVGLDNRLAKFRLNSGNPPTTNLFSTYGSLFFHDIGVFNLEVGGRYNNHEEYGENITYNITPTVVLNKSVKLYGTLSTAFKAPTLENLFGEFGANLNLKPEESINYEVGVDFRFVENKYNMRIATYKRKLTDAIVYGTTSFINLANQMVQGFELEPSVKLGQLDMRGYYTYMEGTEFNYISNDVANYLVRKPKHVFGLGAGLKISDRFYVSSFFKYNGKRKDGDFTDYRIIELPAYKVLDIYAEYTFFHKRLRLFADLKNVLKEKYTEFYGYNSMGFNMNAGLSFNIR